MGYLTLEDGKVFEGKLFGKKNDVVGEVVFNTSMTGYQEVLTDPSYYGQIVTMTFPLIGNYGIANVDSESGSPKVSGFIIRELCDTPNNFMCETKLDDYLIKNNISGIWGIDTRALTRTVREEGVMRGIITQNKATKVQLDSIKNYECINPVDKVTCFEKYIYNEDSDYKYNVAVLDLGLKRNILRSLAKRGCKLTVFPAKVNPNELLAEKFDGIMMTNGPGDPADNVEIVENIKGLVGKMPIFGICLGHQLLALAHGASSKKLKYGHRGANHPVKDLSKDRVYITSQNHGYTINDEKLSDDIIITHLNWNDQTIEGIRYKNEPTFSVQFHPEAAPGPQETEYLFDEFIQMMEGK
jgi:carbamoyl-phosphate synthase small subunit